MTARGLEKSDLGKNRFYSALNMPYLNGKIIGAERVQLLIGYSGYSPVVVCASFTCEFVTSYAGDVMDNTVLAQPL